MARERNRTRAVWAIRRALDLVTKAMDLLDAHGAPPDAAAHLAMAQQRLRQVLARDDS